MYVVVTGGGMVDKTVITPEGLAKPVGYNHAVAVSGGTLHEDWPEMVLVVFLDGDGGLVGVQPIWEGVGGFDEEDLNEVGFHDGAFVVAPLYTPC